MKATEVYCLQPAKFALDGGAMFGIIPKPLWEKKIPPDEENRIPLVTRLILMKRQSQNLIIDTGIGEYNDDKFNSMFAVESLGFERSLAACNLDYEDITDLVLTHLHFDHAGGLGIKQDGQWWPRFPNAQLYLHRKHYEYAQNPTSRDAGSFRHHDFQPILDYYIEKKQITWLEGKAGQISQEFELNFVTSDGHTPHMIHPHNNQFIYLADIVPTSHHINIPWVMGYDIYPGQSVVDKQRIYEFMMEKDLTLIFEHDKDLAGGKITYDGKKYQLSQPIDSNQQLSQLV